MKPLNRQAASGMSYAPSQDWRPDRVPSSDHVLTKEAQAKIRKEKREEKDKRKISSRRKSEGRSQRLAGDHATFATHVLPAVVDLVDEKALLYEPIADRLNEAGHGRLSGTPWDGKTIRKMLRRYRPDLFELPRTRATEN